MPFAFTFLGTCVLFSGDLIKRARHTSKVNMGMLRAINDINITGKKTCGGVQRGYWTSKSAELWNKDLKR